MPSPGSVGGALLGGGLPVVQGLLDMGGLNSATGAQLGAQGQANQLFRDLYSQTTKDFAPYQAGSSAFDLLMQSYGIAPQQKAPHTFAPGSQDAEIGEGIRNANTKPVTYDFSGFYNSPDYQMAQQQGSQTLDRSAAARGRLYSGAQMKAQQQFGQDLASQYLNQWRQGLQGISNTGLQATNSLANYRQNYGNQLGGGLTNMGDIRAANRLGRSNIVGNMIGGAANALGTFGGMNSGGGQSSYGRADGVAHAGNWLEGGYY